MEQGTRFKAMYASLGLTVDDVANFLQVSPRTVQLWISGRVRIPYAAYKLMRLQLHYELPGDAWNGWHLSAGRLYTPENHELNPQDFVWWSLLVRQARMFKVLFDRQNPRVAGWTAAADAGQRLGAAGRAQAKSGPTGVVGRPAQPAGPNSFIGHISTGVERKLDPVRLASGYVDTFPPCGKEKNHG
jgi:transcriptional regulator with XRE-family HTH domain